MRAMILNSVTDLERSSEPLVITSIPDPVPADHEVLVKVTVCGVCHIELDEIEEANIALSELKKRKIRGAKVLVI